MSMSIADPSHDATLAWAPPSLAPCVTSSVASSPQSAAEPVATQSAVARSVRPLDEDMPAHEFTVARIHGPRRLTELRAEWERLQETSVSANAFQTPWFLLPALQHLSQTGEVEVWAVEAPTRVNPTGKKLLCGLFPLVRRRSFYGLPVGCLELWQHPYGFLSTPLIRRDCVGPVLSALFAFARDAREGAPLLHFPGVDGQGPFHSELVDWLARERRSFFLRDVACRALFTPAADAESFLTNKVARKRRHEAQRMERRLHEAGDVRFQVFAAGDELEPWLDQFLQLEASGWKGREGTAIRSNLSHEAFFREMARGAADAGRLQMLRLEFAGRTIALTCNLMAGDGGFGFKIAYDETMAKFSPGVLLELEQIRRLHESRVAWVDSCAASDHPMINHWWPDRAVRQSLVVSSGGWRGDLAVSLAPLVRWARRSAFPKTKRSVSDSSKQGAP